MKEFQEIKDISDLFYNSLIINELQNLSMRFIFA